MKSSTTESELRDFHRSLGAKLKNSSARLSPEKALEEWREQHPDGVEFEDDTKAIQEAVDDMVNGEYGTPADVVLAELRRRIRAKTKNR